MNRPNHIHRLAELARTADIKVYVGNDGFYTAVPRTHPSELGAQTARDAAAEYSRLAREHGFRGNAPKLGKVI